MHFLAVTFDNELAEVVQKHGAFCGQELCSIRQFCCLDKCHYLLLDVHGKASQRSICIHIYTISALLDCLAVELVDASSGASLLRDEHNTSGKYTL